MINRLGDGEILETRFETMDGTDELFPSRNVMLSHAFNKGIYTAMQRKSDIMCRMLACLPTLNWTCLEFPNARSIHQYMTMTFWPPNRPLGTVILRENLEEIPLIQSCGGLKTASEWRFSGQEGNSDLRMEDEAPDLFYSYIWSNGSRSSDWNQCFLVAPGFFSHVF